MRLVRGTYVKKSLKWSVKEQVVYIIDTNDEGHLLGGISLIDLIISISLKEYVFSCEVKPIFILRLNFYYEKILSRV